MFGAWLWTARRVSDKSLTDLPPVPFADALAAKQAGGHGDGLLLSRKCDNGYRLHGYRDFSSTDRFSRD